MTDFGNVWRLDAETGVLSSPATPVEEGAEECMVSPGLVDVHINGAFHVDFSHYISDSAYVTGLRAVARLLPRTGVVAFVPTLFSSTASTYGSTLPLLGKVAMEGVVGARVLGWHAEGPFMNMERRGAHSADHLRLATDGLDTADEVMVWKRFEQVYGADNLLPNLPFARMITLAPELFDDTVSAHIIRTLTARGIVVAIGHSSCTSVQMENAVKAGATLVTHLFNAMPGLHHRTPGIVGHALDRRETTLQYSLIADGIHVVDTALAIAFSARPDACVLITDALPLLHDSATELPDGVYDWKGGGADRQLRKEKQQLFAHNSDTLAGSCVPLCDHVLRLARVAPDLGIGPAILAASRNALRVHNLTSRPNDTCLWKRETDVHGNLSWALFETYIDGRCHFTSRDRDQH